MTRATAFDQWNVFCALLCKALCSGAIGALVFGPASAAETRTYPPQSAYLMTREAEVALAKSAAPAAISDQATIKVLTPTGYETVHTGDNGFVCLVMRGWANSGTYTPVAFRELGYNATIRAPICLTPAAVRMVLPYIEMKDKLGISGKTPDQIVAAVETAYATGKLPARTEVSFAYMWSAQQHLNVGADQEGTSLDHWHPHLMIYAPYATNAGLGGNPFGSLPIVGDDAGTPFAVIYVPLDHKLSVPVHAK